MKDKLEPNMYVRYTRGAINGYVPPRIGKILERLNDSEFLKLDTNCTILENDIIGEPSFNPIDIIEVGDYVNGRKVYQVGYNFQDDYVLKMSESNYEDFIFPNEIKSIVTKEMFSSIEYRLGDE